MDYSDQNPVFPHNVSRCIDPGIMNLFTVDDSSITLLLSSLYSRAEPGQPSTTGEHIERERRCGALVRRRRAHVANLQTRLRRHLATPGARGPEAPVLRARGTPAQLRASSGGASARRGSVPHNLVERKYRNTLNAEMERLRSAIPHMARISSGDTEAGGGGGARLS